MNHPYEKKLRFSTTDFVVFLAIAVIVYGFFHRMGTVLDYQWDWGLIPDYLIRIDSDSGKFKTNLLVQGFIATIKLSIWATLLAFVLGTFFGLMRARGSSGQRFSGWLYVETIRNIPSLVLVFIFYFFVSSQFLDTIGIDLWLKDCPEIIQDTFSFLFTGHTRINAFISAVITLALYEGAYVTEIVRGGIAGIPKGQWDAGFALGMSRYQTFKNIILPQALRNILSPLAGQFISTIKDSAIMSVISIEELTFHGMEIMATTFLTFEVWITITVLYFILTFPLSRLTVVIEKHLASQY